MSGGCFNRGIKIKAITKFDYDENVMLGLFSPGQTASFAGVAALKYRDAIFFGKRDWPYGDAVGVGVI